LVVLADYVVLLLAILLRLLISVFVVFVAGREREAGVALKKVTNPVELFPELLLAFVVLNVLEQLINNAAEAPEIARLVVRFLH
jgi:ABC-type dipeptide/oligopeptide/nickel transport system permease subunit